MIGQLCHQASLIKVFVFYLFKDYGIRKEDQYITSKTKVKEVKFKKHWKDSKNWKVHDYSAKHNKRFPKMFKIPTDSGYVIMYEQEYESYLKLIKMQEVKNEQAKEVLKKADLRSASSKNCNSNSSPNKL